jgi:tryptophan-rich sensory protein
VFYFNVYSKSMYDVRLFAPMILGFGVSSLCPIQSNEGSILPQRPPSCVFGIVWPILFMLVGYSWTRSKGKANILMTFLVFLLTLWTFVFSCLGNPKIALYILACILGTTIGCMILLSHHAKVSMIALIPLLSWCFLAFLLNWDIVG